MADEADGLSTIRYVQTCGGSTTRTSEISASQRPLNESRFREWHHHGALLAGRDGNQPPSGGLCESLAPPFPQPERRACMENILHS